MTNETREPEVQLTIKEETEGNSTVRPGLNALSLGVVVFILVCGVYGVSVASTGELNLGVGSRNSQSTQEPATSPTLFPTVSPTNPHPSTSPTESPTSLTDFFCEAKPTDALDLLWCQSDETVVFCSADGSSRLEDCSGLGGCQCEDFEFFVVQNGEFCGQTSCVDPATVTD
eukprot:snap_masked-scaffold_49-processed-gene-1.69-mRNA-1 protein AED:1.00 eAED:1.00 QI:0/-1/0/0/-1/1/1/0/171